MADLPEVPQREFPILQVDPKDEKIEILLAYIKDLQGIIEILKDQLKEAKLVKPVPHIASDTRPKINSSSELRYALERASEIKAERIRVEKEQALKAEAKGEN